MSSREINKKNEFKPFATQANTTRVQLMNKKNKFEFTVDILDLYEDGNPIGTSVVINMPLIK